MNRSQPIAQKRDRMDPFSLAFLDIISCGFGAVVVLVLIFRFDPGPNTAKPPQADTAAAYAGLMAEADLTKKADNTKADLAALAKSQAAQQARLQDLQNQLTILQKQRATKQGSNQAKQQQLAALRAQIERTKQAGAPTDSPDQPDDEAGGILVDRDYVIFIVDTSGSMRDIWGRVADRMTKILEQHPRVKGIQIMNDNGSYLVSAYAKRWITDTPNMRARILRLFDLWTSASNSSPVEGLTRALTDFNSSTQDMSIYVLGDDYSGSDFDGAIETIRRLNKGGARINAINFISPNAATDRFSILMREIALDNGGTLVTM